MQQNKLVCIPMAKIFIYLFTTMLCDVTITSLLCLCKICYKTEVPAGRFIREQEHFCQNVMVSIGVSRTWVRQTWSSLILAQRSIVHTIFESSWERVCCLISKQDVTNTNGHFNRMVRRHTQHVIPHIIWRKKTLISSSLTCGPQTAPILILFTVLFGGPSPNSLSRTKI